MGPGFGGWFCGSKQRARSPDVAISCVSGLVKDDDEGRALTGNAGGALSTSPGRVVGQLARAPR